MQINDILHWFVITSFNFDEMAKALLAVGNAVFAIIEFCDWFNITYRKAGTISEDTKRQMAGGLAFALPLISYVALGFLEGLPFSVGGLALAAGLGFVAAKQSHDLLGRYTRKVTGAEAEKEAAERAEHRANAPHQITG